MVGGETARVREDHVGDAGAALQAEDRGARMGRMRTNHDDRQRDQPRVRIGAVLGHHERPAIRGGGALFGGIGARVHGQLACMRAGRHGDGRRTAGEVEVAEPEREDGDQGQAGDPAATEASGRGMHGSFFPVGRHHCSSGRCKLPGDQSGTAACACHRPQGASALLLRADLCRSRLCRRTEARLRAGRDQPALVREDDGLHAVT